MGGGRRGNERIMVFSGTKMVDVNCNTHMYNKILILSLAIKERHSTQQSPPQFLRRALGCVTVVTVDMGFLVEAQSEEKLSEKLFGAVNICQMEITSTTFINNAMPSKNVLSYEDESENEDELWVLL
ncbi:protein of unknown function-containing protein [Forsythia ovata]|uniref:Protein ENHANCED DISEASE RESISTANCE 2 C-terminal domain-containing protein n=1 Tax=Forsythia ovata TaxID=205694 RepID=A0ABD1T711_9LAMI